MSLPAHIADSQAQHFLRMLGALRPHWRRDPHLPARIQHLLTRNRAHGSRDRRLYRELIYTALRHLPWIESQLDAAPAEAVRRVAWLAADTPDTRAFRTTFATGEPPAGDPAELLPAWFRDHCPTAFAPAELAALNSRAPLWLRLQTDDPAPVLAEFDARGWVWEKSRVLPGAIRLLAEADVTKTAAYAAGLVEVQDLGSQLVLGSVGLEPGGHWLDACAGAGGKSLQLARLVGPSGGVDAHDIRPAALSELKLRAARAGLTNVHVISQVAAGHYANVLVDAPCSGSGTWRRSPHLKWVTAAGDIATRAEQQLKLLRQYALAVRPGGRLVYATCSLSRVENEDVVAAFLAAEPAFAPEPLRERFGFPGDGPALTVLPARHDTDGFFVAAFRLS